MDRYPQISGKKQISTANEIIFTKKIILIPLGRLSSWVLAALKAFVLN